MTTTAQAPSRPTESAVTPDQIFQLAQGFMASKHLFAASELGLFEALGEGPTDLAGLAARTGLTPRRHASAPTPWSRSGSWSDTVTVMRTHQWPRRSYRGPLRLTSGHC